MSALARKHGAINLSQGFPGFDVDEQLLELARKYMGQGYQQYAPMGGLPLLNEAIAAKIERLYGSVYSPSEEITITCGATQALASAITALVQPGDEVILFEPAYDCYRPLIELAGGKVKAYTLSGSDWRIDEQRLRAMCNSRTKLIIVNSPHNPTGSIWPLADWQMLSKLILEYPQLYLLSDEVYEHLCFAGQQHYSALGFEELRERTLACFSFGKTLHVTGWKLGYIVGSAALMREVRKVHQFTVFSVNTPLQYAIAEYISEPSRYEQLGSFFEKKRDMLWQALENSGFRPLPSAGTYFQLIDYSALSSDGDRALAERLVVEAGVATIPVSAFYHEGSDAKLLRLCFAKEDKLLEQAAERLSAWARRQ